MYGVYVWCVYVCVYMYGVYMYDVYLGVCVCVGKYGRLGNGIIVRGIAVAQWWCASAGHQVG